MISEFFRTARLLFRPFLPGDLDALSRIVGDREVARYVDDGEPLNRVTTELWIARSRQNVERFGYGTGAVIEQASGGLIGWAGFARPDEGPEQIIYGFETASWGKGYGGEIVEGLIRFAFDDLRLAEIKATTHPDNRLSQRILRNAGFGEALSNDVDALLFTLRNPAR